MQSHLSFSLRRDQQIDRLNVGIDMGKHVWVMDIHDTRTGKHHRHAFRGTSILMEVCQKVQELLKTGREVEVIYEAGRNGFTLARLVRELGASVTIIPVNKLEVVKIGKKAKSDRLDARALSERNTWAKDFPSVWVPSVDQECHRRLLREKERLEKEIKRNNNRILGILERWPVNAESKHHTAQEWQCKIGQWRTEKVVGWFLPEIELACIENMVRELSLLERSLDDWNRRIAKELQKKRELAAELGQNDIVDVLMQYKGIGEAVALGLAWHIGDFDRFQNSKKFTSYLGLAPVPWLSGGMHKCQGISKSGNPELRRLMIEAAWLWVKHQPDSAIAKKWAPRLKQKGRSRRTAIVAVARQLAVALFRLGKHGDEIAGATKNRPLPVPGTAPGSPLAA